MNPETDPGALPLDPETDKPVPHTGGSTHFECYACELINSPYGARYEQPPNPAPTFGRAREVFVVESSGFPVKVGLLEDRDSFAQSIAAGIRLGRAEGEERLVRYVPDDTAESQMHYGNKKAGHRFRSGDGPCLRCGLRRGHYQPNGSYQYFVNGSWTRNRPMCKRAK